MKEHLIQSQIVKYLRFNCWMIICSDVMAALAHIHGSGRFAFVNRYKSMGYTKGQPDLIAIKKDKILFIEVKSDTGTLSKEQRSIKEFIEESGFTYVIARDIKDLEVYNDRNTSSLYNSL